MCSGRGYWCNIQGNCLQSPMPKSSGSEWPKLKERLACVVQGGVSRTGWRFSTANILNCESLPEVLSSVIIPYEPKNISFWIACRNVTKLSWPDWKASCKRPTPATDAGTMRPVGWNRASHSSGVKWKNNSQWNTPEVLCTYVPGSVLIDSQSPLISSKRWSSRKKAMKNPLGSDVKQLKFFKSCVLFHMPNLFNLRCFKLVIVKILHKVLRTT